MDKDFNAALQNMWDKLDSWIIALGSNLPNIILATLVFILAFLASGLFKKWSKKLLSKTSLSLSLQNLGAKVVSFIIVVIGLVLAFVVLGLEGALTGLLTAAGVSGLVLGLALQGPLSNSFAGIIMSFRNNISIGDWIESNGVAGEVIEISLRDTKIKGPDNNYVFIPNSDLLDSTLKNTSLTSRTRIMIECGVGYSSDLNSVESLTISALNEAFDQIGSNEDVEFFYTEFGGSSINFVARFWFDAEKSIQVLRAKHKAIKVIKKTFDANNINIPFPIRTIQFDKSAGAVAIESTLRKGNGRSES